MCIYMSFIGMKRHISCFYPLDLSSDSTLIGRPVSVDEKECCVCVCVLLCVWWDLMPDIKASN